MKVYVLHDWRLPDKYLQTCLDHLQARGIEHEIFGPIVDSHSVVRSINISHKALIRDAQEAGEPEVCILESDVWFPATDGWEYFLQHKPEAFDLYLGGIYTFGSTVTSLEASPLAWPLRGDHFSGMHCYIAHSRFYDRFLSVPADAHIDYALSLYGEGENYVCYPFAAIQRPGRSANNNNEDVNYNHILHERDVRGKFKP